MIIDDGSGEVILVAREQRPIVWDPLTGGYRYDDSSQRRPRRSWSLRKRRRIAYRDGVWCYLCEEEFALDELTIDHVIPTARGGTNDIENLKLACFACNNEKGDMTLEEYRASKDAA